MIRICRAAIMWISSVSNGYNVFMVGTLASYTYIDIWIKYHCPWRNYGKHKKYDFTGIAGTKHNFTGMVGTKTRFYRNGRHTNTILQEWQASKHDFTGMAGTKTWFYRNGRHKTTILQEWQAQKHDFTEMAGIKTRFEKNRQQMNC